MQIKNGLPLNIGLILNKYVNRFVIGYFENQNWREGKQSDIKRQIYLLRRERIDIIEKLEELKSRKGSIEIAIKERKGIERKRFDKIINPIIENLEECDVEGAINNLSKIIRKIRDKEISKKLKECLEELSKIRLSLSCSLIDNSLYNSLHNRMIFFLNNLKKQGYAIESEILKLNWRLIINLGAASIYETSLLFHRNYSIPYIPGGAVKGVTRHWAVLKFAERVQELKDLSYRDAIDRVNKALENGKDLRIDADGVRFSQLIEIFGTQNKKGKVIFFDALPFIDQNKDLVALDIINVHYKPYYEASERELKENIEKAPGDWHDPIPIFSLTVERETKFRFALASRNEDLVKKAKKLLKEALENIGIGAKTSAGYGYFEA